VLRRGLIVLFVFKTMVVIVVMIMVGGATVGALLKCYDGVTVVLQ
jgi:hypothetical protein